MRQAGGLSRCCQGIVFAGVALIWLASPQDSDLVHGLLALTVASVHFGAPFYIRRWRSSHGLPDISQDLNVTLSAKLRRSETIARVSLGALFIGVVFAMLLLENLHGFWRGIHVLALTALVVGGYHMWLLGSMKMNEDLLMAVSLGLLAVGAIIFPPPTLNMALAWTWVSVGLLMTITGIMLHMRWRRWVAAHGTEAL